MVGAALRPLAVNVPGGVYIDTFVLRVAIAGQRLDLPLLEVGGADASGAREGTRQCYWPEAGGWAQTPIYVLERLTPGNRLQGPAIVQADYTTAVISPGRQFRIDEHGLGILESTDAPREV